MRTFTASFIAILLAMGSFGMVMSSHTDKSEHLAAGESLHVTCETDMTGSGDAEHFMIECAEATEEPGTSGYHEPGSHDGLNGHEHGDAPPQWVLDSGNAPFTQDRESHTGYKGVYAVSPTGVESYLITHIVSTQMARNHGDHDYQFWVRDPETGQVDYIAGVLDFGNPPPLRTSDTGERPIILSVGDGNCETWYTRPGSAVFDLGWTICGRYQSFDGTVLGGEGTFRTMDWVIPCSRLPAGHVLRDNCRSEFGVQRISWIVNSKDYSHPAVEPVN